MNLQQLEDQISNLTLLEASKLVKNLEERLGVSAHPTQVISPTNQEVKEAVQEQTEFSVILTAPGVNKINVIKTVRELTTLGLKEAKDFVDTVPKAIKEGVSKTEAETVAKKLQGVGASVEIK